MSISVQLYTVRHAIEADLPGTIRRLADLGFSQVEPYNFAALADDLGPAFAETGISAPTAHAPLLSADPDEILDAAARLSVGTVIEPYVPEGYWQDADSIRDTARRLNAAGKRGAERGIRVGYHNHWWELESKIEGTTALEYFEGLLDPEVVLEVDTYWAVVGGVDPVALLGRLGERVAAIHIKDGPGNTDMKAQMPVGQGAIDIVGIRAAAKHADVGVIELDDYDGDVFDALMASLSYVRSITAA